MKNFSIENLAFKALKNKILSISELLCTYRILNSY